MLKAITTYDRKAENMNTFPGQKYMAYNGQFTQVTFNRCLSPTVPYHGRTLI